MARIPPVHFPQAKGHCLMTESTASAPASSPVGERPAPERPLRWRTIDIVVAAVLAVATGLIFLLWNFIGGAAYTALEAFTPGISGLVTGIWLLGGVLGGLIIRKPGAAIFVEVIAATVSGATR